jgi:CRP-like cAMP-binding protein
VNDLILDKLNRHFSKCKVRTYAKGTLIISANEEPEGISFLETGIVEQYDITPEGNRMTVNIYRPPAFFPMSWAINKTPNTYFFGALTDVNLRIENPAKTLIFLKSNPDVAYDLLSRVYKGTDALLRRLTLAASDIAANRLIFELLIEAYRFGQDIEDGRKLIRIKQNALAARSGLARETVSRELHKLEKDNRILLTKPGINIKMDSLEEKLGFNT